MGEPVLATIDMRAIPHWMPWAEGGRSLSTFIMSIHHLDTFRYWLGDPARVLASTGPDPRHQVRPFRRREPVHPRIRGRRRASSWDDVWTGPAREGRPPRSPSAGDSRGLAAWPSAPSAGPAGPSASPPRSTGPRLTTTAPGTAPAGPRPGSPTPSPGRWPASCSPSKRGTEPDISGRDNLRTIALCEAVLRGAREHRVTVPRMGSVEGEGEGA